MHDAENILRQNHIVMQFFKSIYMLLGNILIKLWNFLKSYYEIRSVVKDVIIGFLLFVLFNIKYFVICSTFHSY